MTMIFLILFTHYDISHLLVSRSPYLIHQVISCHGDLGMVPSGYVNIANWNMAHRKFVSFPMKNMVIFQFVFWDVFFNINYHS